MPLYDLILQVKSHVPKGDVFNLLKRTSLKVIDADGVLMDVKSFGLTQTLAYPYKKPNERHHEVQMSQLTFASAESVAGYFARAQDGRKCHSVDAVEEEEEDGTAD